MNSGSRLRRILRREASNPQQSEILIPVVKLMVADWPKNEEVPFHIERFVDSWVKETFIWTLAAFFISSITENLNSRIFYSLKILQHILHSAIRF